VTHSRRDVLRTGAALAALTALGGCDRAGLLLGRGEPLPDRVELAAGSLCPVFHLVARAGYAARPGEAEAVRARGAEAWIEEQLRPESIDDSACDLRLAGLVETIGDEPMDLRSVAPELVDRDLVRAALVRAVHSRRRVLESMVGLWCDHFSIQVQKKGCRETKPWDDREVIRRHALGRFRDLVEASAKSPAMLRYLDNAENRRATGADHPNENYARELLELHTLGVHGGYSQKDVMEAARCLSGWTLDDVPGPRHVRREIESLLRPSAQSAAERAGVTFRKDWHDDGAKVVLGVEIPAGGGERDLGALLDVVCRHPSTARHVAWKVCRRFVADAPPASVVESAAREFTRTDGDLRAVVRHVLGSPEFAASAGSKTRRPWEFVVAALRATGAECRADDEVVRFLERMGHVPFHYPTPDGYPEEPEPWMGTLLWRWNFAVALATGRLGRTRCDLAALARAAGLDPARDSPAELAPLFLGRSATSGERAAIDAYVARDGGVVRERREEAVALLLCSPGFQVT
jgi:uncharacterized protein (DUF1800 family)